MTITAQFGEIAIAPQYTKFEDGFPSNQKAYAKITLTGIPADSNTVVVNGITYTFKTSPATAGDVLIGATTKASAQNLADAINGKLSAAVFAGTTASLAAWADPAENIVYLNAWSPNKSVGNALTLTKTGTNITVSGATFSGGITGGKGNKAQGVARLALQPSALDQFVIGTLTYVFTAGTPAAFGASTVEVKIGATVDVTLGNLAKAVNASGVAGTDYSSATPANSDIQATSYTDLAIFLEALVAGSAGNSLVLTKTGTNLAVSGSGTILGGSDSAAYDETALSWLRLRAQEIDYGDAQMQTIIPLEIGGTMTPTGAYKQGVAVAGGAQIMPRMEKSLGDILLATLGKASSSFSGGVGTHVFTFNTNEIDIPWVAVRRMIPGRDQILGNGIVGFDNKVNVMRITIAAASPLQTMLQFIGRFPRMDNHPEVWSGDSFEDFKSIPLACVGQFKLPTVSGLPDPLPVTNVIVEMANVTTTPREEMIVGSFYPDDVVPRTRAMTFRFIYKWRDASLAQYLFGNQLKATAWSPTPFTTVSSGSDFAVDLLAESEHPIAGTDTPYSLRIQANEVFWQPGAMRLRAGDIVLMDITGTVLYNSNGYVKFTLKNGQNASTYNMPTEP